MVLAPHQHVPGLAALLATLLVACGEDADPIEVDPDLSAYIQLIADAEQRTKADPPEMLAIMRQLYYGRPWSATSTNTFWQLVIPCSPDLPDPRSELGDTLFDALAARAETGGVDMGHVFAGLEAMVCPSPKVIIVEMSNEAFSTWGGDLGAAVAARSACLALGQGAAANADCGAKPGGQPLDFYLQHHAPPQDLAGDLDPFAMRAALLSSDCASSPLTPLVLDRPLSEVLGDYYLEPSSPLGQARRRRDRCILELLGATLSSGAITNRADVIDRVSTHLLSFAETYYVTVSGDSPSPAEVTAMKADARTAMDSFLSGLDPS